ncbi:hypothetical protein I317_07158 [Kwoniella heveanensis CBS 569]|nr:hypothetical protein I317_07158 [Kwoniella heveanensis CBS 569]
MVPPPLRRRLVRCRSQTDSATGVKAKATTNGNDKDHANVQDNAGATSPSTTTTKLTSDSRSPDASELDLSWSTGEDDRNKAAAPTRRGMGRRRSSSRRTPLPGPLPELHRRQILGGVDQGEGRTATRPQTQVQTQTLTPASTAPAPASEAEQTTAVVRPADIDDDGRTLSRDTSAMRTPTIAQDDRTPTRLNGGKVQPTTTARTESDSSVKSLVWAGLGTTPSSSLQSKSKSDSSSSSRSGGYSYTGTGTPIFLSTFPASFPIETHDIVETEGGGRGYIFLKDQEVADSMLIFVSFFATLLVLTVVMIKANTLFSSSSNDERGKVDNVIGDDMKWAEGREVIERKIIWESAATPNTRRGGRGRGGQRSSKLRKG